MALHGEPPVLTLLQIFDGQNGQDLLLRGNTLVGILAGNLRKSRYETTKQHPTSTTPSNPSIKKKHNMNTLCSSI